MAGLVPAIHVFIGAEATPFFERLCPGMTEN
jgi:hypothetical protein